MAIHIALLFLLEVKRSSELPPKEALLEEVT